MSEFLECSFPDQGPLTKFYSTIHIVDKDIPILPIHDSFIMHHGYGYLGDLEEAMRSSYYDIFKSDIGINEEIYKEVKIDKPKSDGNIEWDNIEFDHILY